ncbi:hypothetical protein FJ546_20745 [Mesorhizobium sp. B2-4-19]|uniref:hypothetical protein n=1 Tax=Mesorhizobium sp. B2-4-19 TaxID=2589930 RepID=UPI0011289B2B|nr:hypothetical protein [Mesorhizobium sp. B2-4-19]TPK60125.1 hypothetical protein FJ546_20745 [Mesorhizobium sp. B2-4-19]
MEVISSDRVETLIDLPALIDALREGFRQGAVTPPRVRHEVNGSDGASLFVMPAWQPGVGRVVKLMSAVPANVARGLRTSSEVLSMFDPVTGELCAVIESRSLTKKKGSVTVRVNRFAPGIGLTRAFAAAFRRHHEIPPRSMAATTAGRRKPQSPRRLSLGSRAYHQSCPQGCNRRGGRTVGRA